MFYKFMLLSLIFKILFLGLLCRAVFSQQQRHCIKQSEHYAALLAGERVLIEHRHKHNGAECD